MRKELPYFQIGSSFGGNQDWFKDPMMNMGGCAEATACDACICMALYNNKSHMYPYDIQNLNKEDYIKFSMKMKPYLTPRFHGIDTLKLYMDGFREYLKDVGERNIQLETYSGDLQVVKATLEIKSQIDQGKVIPYLLLRHKDSYFKDFVWHWFLIIGYEEFEDEFYVKVATYGNYHWLSFRDLWKTGYRRKGGMILIR